MPRVHPKKAGGEYAAPGRVPSSDDTASAAAVNSRTPSEEELAEIDKREAVVNAPKEAKWLPVKGSFPRLVYKTENKMYDWDASDMIHGDENRETIETYGLGQPFKQKSYDLTPSPNGILGMGMGSPLHVLGEDPFSLPASEHFKRMRGLAFGFSSYGETQDIFPKMVDKFERNEGGCYTNPLLDSALSEHETTKEFHITLKRCLSENIHNGELDKNILNITSEYMRSSKGARLPMFTSVIDGTVLTVHGIAAMEV